MSSKKLCWCVIGSRHLGMRRAGANISGPAYSIGLGASRSPDGRLAAGFLHLLSGFTGGLEPPFEHDGGNRRQTHRRGAHHPDAPIHDVPYRGASHLRRFIGKASKERGHTHQERISDEQQSKCCAFSFPVRQQIIICHPCVDILTKTCRNTFNTLSPRQTASPASCTFCRLPLLIRVHRRPIFLLLLHKLPPTGVLDATYQCTRCCQTLSW